MLGVKTRLKRVIFRFVSLCLCSPRLRYCSEALAAAGGWVTFLETLFSFGMGFARQVAIHDVHCLTQFKSEDFLVQMRDSPVLSSPGRHGRYHSVSCSCGGLLCVQGQVPKKLSSLSAFTLAMAQKIKPDQSLWWFFHIVPFSQRFLEFMATKPTAPSIAPCAHRIIDQVQSRRWPQRKSKVEFSAQFDHLFPWFGLLGLDFDDFAGVGCWKRLNF